MQTWRYGRRNMRDLCKADVIESLAMVMRGRNVSMEESELEPV